MSAQYRVVGYGAKSAAVPEFPWLEGARGEMAWGTGIRESTLLRSACELLDSSGVRHHDINGFGLVESERKGHRIPPVASKQTRVA